MVSHYFGWWFTIPCWVSMAFLNHRGWSYVETRRWTLLAAAVQISESVKLMPKWDWVMLTNITGQLHVSTMVMTYNTYDTYNSFNLTFCLFEPEAVIIDSGNILQSIFQVAFMAGDLTQPHFFGIGRRSLPNMTILQTLQASGPIVVPRMNSRAQYHHAKVRVSTFCSQGLSASGTSNVRIRSRCCFYERPSQPSHRHSGMVSLETPIIFCPKMPKKRW